LVTGKNSKAQLHAACKNIILLLNTHVDWKWRDWNIFTLTESKSEQEYLCHFTVYLFYTDKSDLKPNTIKRDK
jgi:hypothetical protein